MKTQKQKRIYGVCTNARFLNDFLMNAHNMRKAKKANSVDDAFAERIMLAVTQVNGCRMCSYHHTQQALETGMDGEEIARILSGEMADVPSDEAPALFFAQHYAEKKGRPEKAVYERFAAEYGPERARYIMSYICAIMMGNAQGNIVGALGDRLKGNPEPVSSLWKELSVLVSDVVLIPLLLIKSLLMRPFAAIFDKKRL